MADNSPLLLLFEQPADAIWAAVETFIDGHPIYSKTVQSCSSKRIALRNDGVGIVISRVEEMPALADAEYIFCNIGPGQIHSAIAINLAEDMQAGARIAPVAQCLLRAGVTLGKATGAVTVYWEPAGTVSSLDYFGEAVDGYAEGGPFPALAVVRFMVDSQNVQTVGLDWFSGQEVQFARKGLTQTESIKRLVRIVHDVAVNGAVKDRQTVAGMKEGEAFSLEPSASLGTLVVSPI